MSTMLLSLSLLLFQGPLTTPANPPAGDQNPLPVNLVPGAIESPTQPTGKSSARVTVGPRGLEKGVVELTSRRTGESVEMAPEAAVAKLVEIYAQHR